MRNEFKNTARQILLSSYYDIFPCPNSQNAEHSEQYTAAKVLRHGRDVHPTWVEGRVPCVILTSIGVRFERLRSEEGLR